jgi:hypothetical protein
MENGKWKMENGKWKMELQKIYFSEKSYSSSFHKTTFTLQKKIRFALFLAGS